MEGALHIFAEQKLMASMFFLHFLEKSKMVLAVKSKSDLMKFHVEGDEVDSDLITHHPFLKMIRRHLKKAGPTGTINGACLQPRATMKQIMHEISTLRTDVKERPSFLTANVILFFLGGVCEQNTLNLYLCNDGITRFWKNGDGQRFSVIRKDPPTMIVTLKIEVAVMELLWLGSTIISFHQRKAKLPCCTLHHHTSCNCVRLVVILIVVFPPATRRRGAAAQLEGTGVSAPSDNRESGAGGIPWSDLNVFGGGQR